MVLKQPLIIASYANGRIILHEDGVITQIPLIVGKEIFPQHVKVCRRFILPCKVTISSGPLPLITPHTITEPPQPCSGNIVHA